jgi:hypothetical protein
MRTHCAKRLLLTISLCFLTSTTFAQFVVLDASSISQIKNGESLSHSIKNTNHVTTHALVLPNNKSSKSQQKAHVLSSHAQSNTNTTVINNANKTAGTKLTQPFKQKVKAANVKLCAPGSTDCATQANSSKPATYSPSQQTQANKLHNMMAPPHSLITSLPANEKKGNMDPAKVAYVAYKKNGDIHDSVHQQPYRTQHVGHTSQNNGASSNEHHQNASTNNYITKNSGALTGGTIAQKASNIQNVTLNMTTHTKKLHGHIAQAGHGASMLSQRASDIQNKTVGATRLHAARTAYGNTNKKSAG